MRKIDTGRSSLLSQVLHRFNQWRRSVRPRITPADRAFVTTILSPVEEQLFYQMSPVDQRHCLDVAYDLLELLGLAGAQAGTENKASGSSRSRSRSLELAWAAAADAKLMLKAGLLHDIGKGGMEIPLVARVLFALVPYRLLKEKTPLPALKNAFAVLAEHPRRGAWTARTFGLGEQLASIIESHHELEAAKTPEARLLMAADRRN